MSTWHPRTGGTLDTMLRLEYNYCRMTWFHLLPLAKKCGEFLFSFGGEVLITVPVGYDLMRACLVKQCFHCYVPLKRLTTTVLVGENVTRVSPAIHLLLPHRDAVASTMDSL